MDRHRSSASPAAHAAARDLEVANNCGDEFGLTAAPDDEAAEPADPRGDDQRDPDIDSNIDSNIDPDPDSAASRRRGPPR